MPSYLESLYVLEGPLYSGYDAFDSGNFINVCSKFLVRFWPIDRCDDTLLCSIINAFLFSHFLHDYDVIRFYKVLCILWMDYLRELFRYFIQT